MFDMALKSLNVGRERTVMIGDTPASDVAGAHRAGITGVLVSRKGTPSSANIHARDDQVADAVVQDLTALFDPVVIG